MGSNLVIEVSSATALSGAAHNGALLVCSQPVTITTPFVDMNGGFACTIINLSSGPVTFGSPVITPSGSPTLPPGQSANVRAFSYSGGDAVFIDMPSGVSLLSAPGQATGLTVTPNGCGSVVVSWLAATAGGPPSNYVVNYRQTSLGGTWTPLSAAHSPLVVTGLLATTKYDFQVSAVNASGSGPATPIVTATTTT
jgi:hypothetical protein